MADPDTAPLYRTVAARIAADVVANRTAGAQLPSERELCEQLQVSRVTIRSALRLLAHDGLVVSEAARGWFVARLRARPSQEFISPRFAGFSDLAASLGQTTSAKVLEATTRSCTFDEAEAFGVVPGAQVFELQRLRHLAGLVIAIDRSRVPLQLCPSIVNHDYASTSMYHVLRTAEPPVEPSMADYAVEATAAEPEEIDLLELPPGVPLLVARQRTFDQYGRLCELGYTSYRGDRFRFRASLGTRWAPGPAPTP